MVVDGVVAAVEQSAVVMVVAVDSDRGSDRAVVYDVQSLIVVVVRSVVIVDLMSFHRGHAVAPVMVVVVNKCLISHCGSCCFDLLLLQNFDCCSCSLTAKIYQTLTEQN